MYQKHIPKLNAVNVNIGFCISDSYAEYNIHSSDLDDHAQKKYQKH